MNAARTHIDEVLTLLVNQENKIVAVEVLKRSQIVNIMNPDQQNASVLRTGNLQPFQSSYTLWDGATVKIKGDWLTTQPNKCTSDNLGQLDPFTPQDTSNFQSELVDGELSDISGGGMNGRRYAIYKRSA